MLTEESEIESVLALLSADEGLRLLYEQMILRLEQAGCTPKEVPPTDKDWLSLHIDAGNGHKRPLATLLLRMRDASRSCPQWIEQIRRRSLE